MQTMAEMSRAESIGYSKGLLNCWAIVVALCKAVAVEAKSRSCGSALPQDQQSKSGSNAASSVEQPSEPWLACKAFVLL